LPYKKNVFLYFFSAIHDAFGQSAIEGFLKPADSLNIKRKNTVFITEAVLASGALIGLNQLGIPITQI
jgi:hypothetical protein